MDKLRNLLPFPKRREQEEERSDYFQKNGGLVMKDLIATFGPRYNLPLRSFRLEQLIKAIDNFSEEVLADELGAIYRGSLEGRPVLVKYSSSLFDPRNFPLVIKDIVVTSQMSHHKNVLPLIGCCLESQLPAMVYDNALDHQFVLEMFNQSNNGKIISWRNRIKMAKDVSSVLIYLHGAFPTPIIFRDLKVSSVVIDSYGVAKLVGFGYSISLPPGETKVEDSSYIGTFGFMDPDYVRSCFVTEKSDVYGMGALMLALFAGKRCPLIECAECLRIGNCQHCIQDSRRFRQFLDPKIFEEDGQNEDQILERLLALSTVALRCTKVRGDDRPEMIDVAKHLSQAEKFLRS